MTATATTQRRFRAGKSSWNSLLPPSRNKSTLYHSCRVHTSRGKNNCWRTVENDALRRHPLQRNRDMIQAKLAKPIPLGLQVYLYIYMCIYIIVRALSRYIGPTSGCGSRRVLLSKPETRTGHQTLIVVALPLVGPSHGNTKVEKRFLKRTPDPATPMAEICGPLESKGVEAGGPGRGRAGE